MTTQEELYLMMENITTVNDIVEYWYRKQVALCCEAWEFYLTNCVDGKE